ARAAKKEKAGLLDPYSVDPEPFFQWIADPVQKEVVCRAAKTSKIGRDIFRSCETLLGLNREELKRWRFRTYWMLEALVECLNGSPSKRIRARILKQLQEMMSDDAEFAGMVRYFLRR